MDKVKIGPNIAVNPMPVSLVGSHVEGKVNFMAVAWVMRANANPPMLSACINKAKYTYGGIEETKQFSVCFPSADMVEKADYCGLVSGRKEDKSKVFEVFYGDLEAAPMIKDAPVCFECELRGVFDLPSNGLFIGEIKSVYTEERYMTDGKPDVEKMRLIALTMPDNHYRTTGEKVGKAWHDGLKLKGDDD